MTNMRDDNFVFPESMLKTMLPNRHKVSEGWRTMKEKVNVTGVPETMVQTLYARAKETRKKNAKINDEIA